ncbi:GTP cyclohydrolase II [Neorickettsia sennetsu]|uniref:GTP cyclohydrolase-2 n=1 Tax=Ehrlichia sennetsu (strain ATCC VR-367 / Miyayama) TaxID=222891 RepID=Q2GD25_EHRS3|nr:GTP cyclohydrolase II [Neorickettsia sennetsu]ABD46413.1 GTP cyclohydrolase II [Neorickettsia sennetsu str. Miyayama]
MSLSPERQAAFALCAFKAGIPVIFCSFSKVVVAAPRESCDVEGFFRNYGKVGVSLLLSAERIGFHSGSSNNQSVRLSLKVVEELRLGLELLIRLAETIPASEEEELLVVLAKMAELLPEVLVSTLEFQERTDMLNFAFSNGLQVMDLDAISRGLVQQHITRVSEAKIRIRENVDSYMVCYRSILKEHYAIIIGDPLSSKEPLVRVHSSCYTGDLLGSLSCDCRDQLHDTVKKIAEDPAGGIILYLSQEGRGIGLPNKIRAYNLQEDKGLDTVEANLCLGFKDDERDFRVVRLILKDLGVQKVRLITNNPEKIRQLSSAGVDVASRVPILMRSNPYNHKYLQTKSEKLGHIFIA